MIGNPPYGVNFDETEKKYLTRFDALVPDFEIYIYFISLYKTILKENKVLSYIFPNTFLSTLFGKKYREFIFENTQVYQIIDLSNDNTFVDASVRTCIFSFRKSKEDYSSELLKVENKEFKRIDLVKKNNVLKETDNVLSLFSQNKEEKKLIAKLQKNTILSDFHRVSQGLIPYDKYRGHDEFTIKNRIWHSNFQKDNTYKKELKGGDVSRYSINWNGNLWISYGNWLAAPREQKFFTSERILIREITADRLFCGYTCEEFYNTPSAINLINEKAILNLKYTITLLNSKLIGWLHNKVSPKANKGLFPKILINDIRIIPLVKISLSDQQPFIEKADIMLSLNKQLQEVSSKFSKYFSGQFKIEKRSAKLEKWYGLSFEEFIKEINKAIKTQKGTPLTKKEEFDWIDLFEENKAKANKLQSEISITDKAIDAMVYELYGLSEEEIGIVEES